MAPALNDNCATAEDLGVGATGDALRNNLGATRDGPGIDLPLPADPSETAPAILRMGSRCDRFCPVRHVAGENDNKMWVYAGDECLMTNPREVLGGGCSYDACGVGGGPSFGEFVRCCDRF